VSPVSYAFPESRGLTGCTATGYTLVKRGESAAFCCAGLRSERSSRAPTMVEMTGQAYLVPSNQEGVVCTRLLKLVASSTSSR
jgi:hypothetical protein